MASTVTINLVVLGFSKVDDNSVAGIARELVETTTIDLVNIGDTAQYAIPDTVPAHCTAIIECDAGAVFVRDGDVVPATDPKPGTYRVKEGCEIALNVRRTSLLQFLAGA